MMVAVVVVVVVLVEEEERREGKVGEKSQKGAACTRRTHYICDQRGQETRVHENMWDNACHLIHVK